MLLDDLRSLDPFRRLVAARALFLEVPPEMAGLGRPHHVGFIAGDVEALQAHGFNLVEEYPSQRVSRELRVPTLVQRYQRVNELIEIFIPQAPAAYVSVWIRENRALHVAFETANLHEAPKGWVAQGAPTDVSGCRILYYTHPGTSCRLELFQCL